MQLRGKLSGFWKGGIRLNLLNQLLVAFAVVLGVGMIYATYQTDQSFHAMIDTTNRYVASQRDTGMLEESAAALSEACREYLSTGEMQYVHQYAGQLEAVLRQGIGTDETAGSDPYLLKARESAVTLSQMESYAIRLMAEARGDALAAYPAIIQSLSLKPEDEALSGEEKRAAALAVLTNEAYLAAREQLTRSVDDSHRTVSQETQVRTGESASMLTRLVHRQKVLIGLFLAAAFLAVWINSALIIRPLKKSIGHLDQRDRIPVKGSYEMRRMARVYNDVLEENNEKNEALSYSATHDPLTGLYNRGAYDQAYREMDQRQIGVLIIDVDRFKHFNDEHGHDVGDRVLKRVADVLRLSFRAQDHISRIGGDEFCVIMQGAGREQGPVVKEKVNAMNALLSRSEDDLPPISLSVGVAFGDREHPSGDIFKDADTALYRMKQKGRTGCEIFE